MRTTLIVLSLLAAAGVLAACGLDPKPLDPNLMLPPSERQQEGPGLFTGEDGKWTIYI